MKNMTCKKLKNSKTNQNHLNALKSENELKSEYEK
jgi:hypothetical protein